MKPKMTKEERKRKYTEIARNRRQKLEQSQGGHRRGGTRGFNNIGSSKQNVCYKCREPGHIATNCPLLKDSDTTSTVSCPVAREGDNNNISIKPSGLLCYKCGSTEHSLSSCPKRKRSGKSKYDDDLPFATCFVCNQMGHLASRCPQNTKGIYVNGGSCRVCGSQTHLANDCPDKKRRKTASGEDNKVEQLADDLLEQDPAKTAVEKKATSSNDKEGTKKKRRVITF
ncbi:zinc knuckle domain containing protein [Nitzschia inconspicua]|uniref:Zinc knuckle domain containing protein n=1 Tax=Nitzschia inconspicua TaxID=303405 RepID=A0A9K3LEU4_9STRA|nr:zinc knuckle domain containing protein [Nitzschia inconspicua]